MEIESEIVTILIIEEEQIPTASVPLQTQSKQTNWRCLLTGIYKAAKIISMLFLITLLVGTLYNVLNFENIDHSNISSSVSTALVPASTPNSTKCPDWNHLP